MQFELSFQYIRMSWQILELFLSKVGEQIAEYAHKVVKGKNELETLQTNLKSLISKASDVEERIKNAEVSGQKKRKREVEVWLGQVRSIETEVVELGTQVESAGFIRKFLGGGKATELNEQVGQLVEQSRHFGELLTDVCEARGGTLLTARMLGGAFKQNLEKIWSLLETRRVSSIGIHGMGGVGKTTLAKNINNRLLEKSQGSVFWVTVSQEFSVKSLQDKIARCVDLGLLVEDDEDIRAARLHGALSKHKNSVLILDDVWENIDLLKVGCPFSVECCRLIMTTRSFEVCRQIGCQEVIAVHKLGEDEAWNLFNETLTLGNEIKLGLEVEAIAKSVAKLCDGLPLGIVTLGASMRGETNIHTWRNALVELKQSVTGHDGMGEIVFQVLKYSFDRLKKNHQSRGDGFDLFQLCFLHCSLYPEDQEIHKHQLIRRLISDGLVDKRDSRSAQVDLGHYILDKLVNVSLLESCVDYFGYDCVKMHDLVRGMALRIGRGRYMVRAGEKSLKEIPKEEEWTEDLEKVSLFRCDIRRIEEGTSPNCPNLSTLLLQGNRLKFIPNSFFYKMQGLCTLDLRDTSIRELPNSLSDLKSLKALLLQYCEKLEYVPYLGNMKALRELDLSHTAIKEVPQGVEELLNLRFLSLDGADELKVLRSGLLCKLGSLQYVSFPYHLEASIEEIMNLKEVEEFRGTVKSVGDFNCLIESYRVHGTFYSLLVGQVDYNFLEEYPEEDERQLYNKVVILTGCNLADEKVSGEDIEWLEMSGCEGLSKCLLDDIINPTSLRQLKMCTGGGTEFILSAQETSFQLSRLEGIWLRGLDDFKGVIDTPTPAPAPAPAPPQCVFLSLKRLHIYKCNKMRKLGLPVSGFPNLEDISIEWCREIEEIFEDEGRGESVTLPKLKELTLLYLPRLESVCRTTMICNSIERIRMKKCPRLMKKLPLHLDVPPPPTLRRIEVERELWESLEWDTNPDLPPLLQPLPSCNEFVWFFSV